MAGRIAYYGGIVRDGLVLNLDAAKRDSYPGTGNTWRDISVNQNNGTLVNGPTFNSNNGGSIVFDGADDYVTLPNIAVSTLPAFSVSFWARTSIGVANSCTVYSEGTPDSWPGNLFVIYYGDTLLNPGIIRVWFGGGNVLIGTTDIVNAGWKHVTYIQTSTSSRKLYLNTVLEASNSTNIGSSTASTALIGANNNNGNIIQYFNGTVSNLTSYNRALTESEMTQNYNATKTRYGL